jgi:integrase
MNPSQLSIEPSFADAIAAIVEAAELPPLTRQQWCSALRQIARYFGQEAGTIPARFSAVRARMSALHHGPAGCKPKTLANTRSNAKAALLWFRKERGLPPDGVELTAAWKTLHGRLGDPSTRYRLAPLMRYCSAIGVGPEEVNDGILGQFLAHRESTSSRSSDAASRRIIARLWNDCVESITGWPGATLAAPAPLRKGGLAFEMFPETWQRDVGACLESHTRVHRLANGQRRAPCKPSTLQMRKRELVAAANMAVRSGIAPGQLTSLEAMLRPPIANAIIDAYWSENGDSPGLYAINLACRFVSLARQIGNFDETALTELEDLRFALEQHREDGMTEKNLAVIRSVLTPGVWERIVRLPDELMARARAIRKKAPVHAAVLAQMAVAVAILTVAPLRLANLTALRLKENLVRRDGADLEYWLLLPRYDVKNRRSLQFRLDQFVSGTIEEYVFHFRPALLRGNNDDWLFPGRSNGHKEKISFSTQIVNYVQRACGLRITVHQYRHAAGALILKHRPGDIELVRCLLGHKSIETTKRFYLDLETTMASEIYTDIVRNKVAGSAHRETTAGVAGEGSHACR